MPAFNHEAFVGLAAESALNQSCNDLELIVIDDASADATWETVNALADPRLHLFRHETNQGAHATLNEAVALARGEYLAIINSDDLFLPDRLDRLIQALRDSGGRSELVYSGIQFIDASGAQVSENARVHEYHHIAEVCRELPPRIRGFAGNLAVSTSNFFFTRTLWEQVGGFAALRYTHDWDWLLRAARHTEPLWIDEPLLAYRLHAANTVSEADVLRHVHENSFIQAQALMSLALDSVGWAGTGLDVCRALTANSSFHPFPVLCYLLQMHAEGEDALGDMNCGTPGSAWLARFCNTANVPQAFLQSIGGWNEMAETLATQAALLDERWAGMQSMSAMIDERDKQLSAQAELIDQRWRTIQEMSQMIDDRNAHIAAQASLLEERYQAMQVMSEKIADQSALHSSRLVRLAMWLRRHSA